MIIKFHNTLSGELEEFSPLKKNEVTLYTCGPTVYHYAHIGNFRTFVFEDLLRRFLEFKGYKVKHVMNITDVDDKTIAGAQREKKTLSSYTEYYTHAFLDDMKTLNMLLPTVQPRATGEISAMLDMIRNLIAKGVAYVADGSVYYRVSAFPGYGKLSKKKLDGNIEGARVDVDEYEKEEGADFVLWKAAKEGEPSWDSPWGKGRPGWHIECSAMSMKYLGETMDIHAGGEDLVFPHHENEIAQSEAATGKQFVKYWLHAKHLLVNGEKMSKSKGNFFTLRDLLEKGYDPMAIRYALLSVHYRNQLNFTFESLKEAREVIEKLDNCYWNCFLLSGEIGWIRSRGCQPLTSSYNLKEILENNIEAIIAALANDLNVSVALATLLEGVGEINKVLEKIEAEEAVVAINYLKQIDSLFGFDIVLKEIPDYLEKIYAKRDKIRADENFKQDAELQKKSDDLRDEIQKLGWFVKDSKPTLPSVLKKIRRAWDIKK